jgi:multisubunit Na+/H+ antiporter MnhE subunit
VKNKIKVALIFCSTLMPFYLLWLIFTGTFELHELLIGIIAAVFASVGMVVLGLEFPVPFSPSISDLLALWRLPWYLLSGTWEIFEVAAKDVLRIDRAKSLFRISRFDAGSKDDPRKTARRALATTYTTVAPNFIVLGVNASNQRLLFHQIQRSSVPKMTEQLGAEA